MSAAMNDAMSTDIRGLASDAATGRITSIDALRSRYAQRGGNNRLDTFANIIETGRAGLLFLVPGIDETLRINGTAELCDDPALLELARSERRLPKLVIRIGVEEAYLHCAKALMRSRLWAPESQVERSVLPTMGRMIYDQGGIQGEPETQEQMVARYAQDL